MAVEGEGLCAEGAGDGAPVADALLVVGRHKVRAAHVRATKLARVNVCIGGKEEMKRVSTRNLYIYLGVFYCCMCVI